MGKAKKTHLPAIVHAGHPVLRMEARPLSREEMLQPETAVLVNTMVAVMRAAPGVGLAAPQIGLPLQIIVVEDRADYVSALPRQDAERRGRVAVPLTVIFNPRLKLLRGATARFHEGCLSVPGYSAEVERALQVVVEGFDDKGEPLKWEAQGWPARILQHECDHLAGTLYVDRMQTRTFSAVSD